MNLDNLYQKNKITNRRLVKGLNYFIGLTGVFVLWACLEGPQGPPGESITDTLYVAGDTLVIRDTLIQIDTVIVAGDTIVFRDTVFIDSVNGGDDSVFKLLGTNIQNGDSGEIARLRLRQDDIPSSLHFTARFSRDFDKISTLNCITISPSLPSYLTEFLWSTGADLQIRFDMLKHFPAELVPQYVGMEYQVTFESCLMDIEGNSLQNPGSYSFVPEPYFRLVGYEKMPYDPLDARIFDQDSLIIVPDSTISKFSTIVLEFNSYIDSSIVPYISWPNTDSLEIEEISIGRTLSIRPSNPESSLPHDYMIFISSTMVDAYGHEIIHGYEIQFRVEL